MAKQTVVVLEDNSTEEKIKMWLGCGGIIAVVIFVLFVIASCDIKKGEKAAAISSIETTRVEDEISAFETITQLRQDAENARLARADSDKRADEQRETERKRLEAAMRIASEKATKIEEEVRQGVALQSDLKDFAMTEAPAVWTALQNMRAERASLDNRLSEIAGVFGNNPSLAENDETYVVVLKSRNDIIRQIRTGYDALEEAYRLSVRAKANPTDKSLVRQKMAFLSKATTILRKQNP